MSDGSPSPRPSPVGRGDYHGASPLSTADRPDPLARYVRQAPHLAVGRGGAAATGCGRGAGLRLRGPGSNVAEARVRAGAGRVRIVDRDFVDLGNLQRQVLFDEDDVAAGLPKAVAAAEKLRRINSSVAIEPVVAQVDFTNIVGLCEGMDVILDGTETSRRASFSMMRPSASENPGSTAVAWAARDAR